MARQLAILFAKLSGAIEVYRGSAIIYRGRGGFVFQQKVPALFLDPH